MTIETIADTVKQLQNKYDETDPFRLAKAMKITVKLRPMGIYEGCCKGFFLISRRMKHITINSDLPELLQKVVLSHELGHCVLHADSAACTGTAVTYPEAFQKSFLHPWMVPGCFPF